MRTGQMYRKIQRLKFCLNIYLSIVNDEERVTNSAFSNDVVTFMEKVLTLNRKKNVIKILGTKIQNLLWYRGKSKRSISSIQ